MNLDSVSAIRHHLAGGMKQLRKRGDHPHSFRGSPCLAGGMIYSLARDFDGSATRRLQADYLGEYENLLNKAGDGRLYSDTETLIAKRIIARETMAGKTRAEEDRVRVAMLIHAYRDEGTEVARALAIRRDPNMTPYGAEPSTGVRKFLNSELSKPPNQYQYEPSHENRPNVIEVIDRIRSATQIEIEPVSARELQPVINGFEQTTGASVVLFRSPEWSKRFSSAGFSTRTSGNLIFVNAESRVPIHATLVHELTHLAERDVRSDYPSALQLIHDQLGDEELAILRDYISAKGYAPNDVESALRAKAQAATPANGKGRISTGAVTGKGKDAGCGTWGHWVVLGVLGWLGVSRMLAMLPMNSSDLFDAHGMNY